jgi:hypothetical protein
VQLDVSLLPVSSRFEPTVVAGPSGVRLSWPSARSRGGAVFYRILRGHQPDIACGGLLNNASDDCQLYADQIGVTRGTTFVDHPPKGRWTYRIGVSANWLNDTSLGDVYVLSTPVLVTTG